mmetsp:Transcript_62004/g.134432  ORF Transcript_62004/g.134432 Transcript_62004/m.134432 type:complete len:454 (+) Transcript_62004:66-1427(+)|eukprot:CAMPEP_0170651124 /NCGR_PEP_ID=MMETSP0224-20130122/46189_1 /TAXON_ID=285029 /ORGANISM="Togula jolla, Strain CCCM 725" /LENGTH=453 /DNA_ID=CAMNT_0010982873 /DNA_START=55 /DNA_END=1416 /DNA_ORIENTATION=-
MATGEPVVTRLSVGNASRSTTSSVLQTYRSKKLAGTRSSLGANAEYGREESGNITAPLVGQRDSGANSAPPSSWRGLCELLWHPICLLLLAWPLGIAAALLKWGDLPCFWLNFLAMIPLAKILGDFTEELAIGLKSDTLGGLLNATFGNAVEMILTVQTLRAAQEKPEYIDVVKGTLLGSVLSNMLLVLGTSFLCGGFTGPDWKGKMQTFSIPAALTNMTMLLLATASWALPTVFISDTSVKDYTDEDATTLTVSRICCIYILISYVAFLFFELYTHIDMVKSSEEDDEGPPSFSVGFAFIGLAISTVLVAVSSEFLVDAIDGLVHQLHGTPFEMGKTFIGVILLPIVGNACEHVGAVRMAMVEKVDITIGIAVGSSTQIALFVVPFSVLIGWMIDVPMDLNFGYLNTTVMIFSVLIVLSVLTDGSANWLEGFMLVVAYFVVATLYLYFPSDD